MSDQEPSDPSKKIQESDRLVSQAQQACEDARKMVQESQRIVQWMKQRKCRGDGQDDEPRDDEPRDDEPAG